MSDEMKAIAVLEDGCYRVWKCPHCDSKHTHAVVWRAKIFSCPTTSKMYLLNVKIKFRHYADYPVIHVGAYNFRDEFAESPDGAYFVIAEGKGLMDALDELAIWEDAHTDFKWRFNYE